MCTLYGETSSQKLLGMPTADCEGDLNFVLIFDLKTYSGNLVWQM